MEDTSQLHASLPTIDWAFIDDMRLLQIEGEPDFVEEMTALFLSETPALCNALRLSVADTNPVMLRRAAHTLKGNCNSIGAKRMAELSQDLERIGIQETTQGAEIIFLELERELGNVRQAFEKKSK